MASIAPMMDVALRFGRTAILARLLVPSEFGIGVAFTVVVATASLVTDMAYDKFLMTRPHDAQALATIHILSLIRGALLALLLFVFAGRIAESFGVPQFAGSFAALSIIPLLSSFSHFGIKQAEGDYDYVPEMWAQLLGALSGFIVVLPTIYFWRDHRAIVVGLIAQPLIYSIASHRLARTAYRLRASRGMLKSALSYGIPLTLNGLGLAILSQFDRALVGHWFDVSTLALYAILLSLMGVPISLIDRIFGKLALSYLISQRTSRDTDAYSVVVFLFGLLSSAYALFVATTFDFLVPLVFGSNFTVSSSVHLLLTARVFFLMQMNGAPSRQLLATGRTQALTWLTVSSAFGLLLSFLLIHRSSTIEMVLLGLLVGDILRFPFFYLVGSPSGSLRQIWVDTMLSGLTVAAVVSVLWLYPELSWKPRGIVFGVGLLGICIQLAAGLPRHPVIRNVLLRTP